MLDEALQLNLVPVRVKDPNGISISSGDKKTVYAEGTLLQVTTEVARKLFSEDRVSLEEMRPEGAPMHVERRAG